jgi:hypothetical protein
MMAWILPLFWLLPTDASIFDIKGEGPSMKIIYMSSGTRYSKPMIWVVRNGHMVLLAPRKDAQEHRSQNKKTQSLHF